MVGGTLGFIVGTLAILPSSAADSPEKFLSVSYLGFQGLVFGVPQHFFNIFIGV